MTKVTFEEFCNFLDVREKSEPNSSYTTDERKFLWNELEHKAEDVRNAILEWARSGNQTELTIPEIVVPKGFWTRHEDCAGKPISTAMLMKVQKMNYVAAVLTIDWIRRAPRDAMRILHRGMI